MRPTLIVVPSPGLDLRPGVLERLEPVEVQAFVTERPVEGLDEAVVRRLPGAAEIDSDPVMVRPEIQQAPRKLAAIVDEDPLRRPTLCHQLVADFHDVLSPKPLVDLDRQRLALGDHLKTGQRWSG